MVDLKLSSMKWMELIRTKQKLEREIFFRLAENDISPHPPIENPYHVP